MDGSCSGQAIRWLLRPTFSAKSSRTRTAAESFSSASRRRATIAPPPKAKVFSAVMVMGWRTEVRLPLIERRVLAIWSVSRPSV